MNPTLWQDGPDADVREAMDWRERVTRRVFAVGKRTKDVVEMRRRCASCHRWIDPDPGGVFKVDPTTVHCGSCLSMHFDMWW